MVLTGPACFDIVSSFRRTYRSFQDLWSSAEAACNPPRCQRDAVDSVNPSQGQMCVSFTIHLPAMWNWIIKCLLNLVWWGIYTYIALWAEHTHSWTQHRLAACDRDKHTWRQYKPRSVESEVTGGKPRFTVNDFPWKTCQNSFTSSSIYLHTHTHTRNPRAVIRKMFWQICCAIAAPKEAE